MCRVPWLVYAWNIQGRVLAGQLLTAYRDSCGGMNCLLFDQQSTTREWWTWEWALLWVFVLCWWRIIWGPRSASQAADISASCTSQICQWHTMKTLSMNLMMFSFISWRVALSTTVLIWMWVTWTHQVDVMFHCTMSSWVQLKGKGADTLRYSLVLWW